MFSLRLSLKVVKTLHLGIIFVDSGAELPGDEAGTKLETGREGLEGAGAGMRDWLDLSTKTILENAEN